MSTGHDKYHLSHYQFSFLLYNDNYVMNNSYKTVQRKADIELRSYRKIRFTKVLLLKEIKWCWHKQSNVFFLCLCSALLLLTICFLIRTHKNRTCTLFRGTTFQAQHQLIAASDLFHLSKRHIVLARTHKVQQKVT